MSTDRVALVDDPAFDAHRAGGPHPERPERLAAAREGLAKAVPEDTLERLSIQPLSPARIAGVHEERYVSRMLSTIADGSGYLDPDTYYGEGSREAVLRAAGGAVALAEALVEGRFPTGLALLRPPGHHARPATAMGFCLLNNVALAAEAALTGGAARVAIVDWDVHHGNGTQEIFEARDDVLFVSLHQFPFYPGTGAPHETGRGRGAGATVNVGMPAGVGPEAYGEAFRRVVLPSLQAFAPEVVLVSAGFDAHERDPLAQLSLDATTYGAMASALLDLPGAPPVGFFLEGGYDLSALADSVEAVARALRGERTPLPEGDPGARGRAAVEATLRHHPRLSA